VSDNLSDALLKQLVIIECLIKKEMKKSALTAGMVMILFFVSVFTGCETYRYGTQGSQIVVENPPWGPPVYPGIRYYYLPDIECYYDIYTREFIFLDHARWFYSPTFPAMYPGFDLNNCFVVIVNTNIYQPWMHHQYYVSHFPRYYYRDYYDHSNIPWVRGYDENFRRAVYWRENERNRARSWDDENLRNNRQFKYSREDRLQKNSTVRQGEYRQSSDKEERRGNMEDSNRNRSDPAGNQVNKSVSGTPRNEKETQTDRRGSPAVQQPVATPEPGKPRETNYYGKPIGQPVKVERKMRNQSENESGEEVKNPVTKRKSNSGRR
jgi:hypothetical protein